LPFTASQILTPWPGSFLDPMAELIPYALSNADQETTFLGFRFNWIVVKRAWREKRPAHSIRRGANTQDFLPSFEFSFLREEQRVHRFVLPMQARSAINAIVRTRVALPEK